MNLRAALFLSMVLVPLTLGGCISKKRQDRAQARIDLGAAYLVEGQTELAIATLEDAVKLDRRNIDGWNQLGMAMMKRGEHERSEAAFRKGLKLNAEDASINLNYAYLLINLDRSEEAIERLEAALHDLSFREPAKVLNNLGFAFYTQGRYGSAETRLREAVMRAPNYCQAWYNLGLVYEKLARAEDAIDAYDHVVMICAEDAAGSYFRAGKLFLENGKKEEGVHYLQRVCEGWPGSPICIEAKESLSGMATP